MLPLLLMVYCTALVVYDFDSASLVVILTAVLVGVSLASYIYMVRDASGSQTSQRLAFMTLVDAETGRVKPEFYPHNAELSVEQYKAMFSGAGTGSTAAVAPAV
jgi:hypothetical protein